MGVFDATQCMAVPGLIQLYTVSGLVQSCTMSGTCGMLSDSRVLQAQRWTGFSMKSCTRQVTALHSPAVMSKGLMHHDGKVRDCVDTSTSCGDPSLILKWMHRLTDG